MDSNSWAARLSSASRRYHQHLQARSEMLMDFEEFEVLEEEIREEYPCPFCPDYFDIVGLCCHIDDEHPGEAKNGVCPVCSLPVRVDMVAHITLHHGNIFKMQHKRKSRKASSHSTLSLLRRELRDGSLQSLFGGSSRMVSSTNTAPDPLLSSFILPMDGGSESVMSQHTIESTSVQKSTNDSNSERKTQQPFMSVKDHEENTKRSDFVQGLLLSMMLDDNL